MSDTCATIKILNPNGEGYLVINEADFDGAVHTLFEDAPDAEDDLTEAAEAEVEGQSEAAAEAKPKRGRGKR